MHGTRIEYTCFVTTASGAILDTKLSSTPGPCNQLITSLSLNRIVKPALQSLLISNMVVSLGGAGLVIALIAETTFSLISAWLASKILGSTVSMRIWHAFLSMSLRILGSTCVDPSCVGGARLL